MEHRVDSVLHPSGRTFYLSSLASGMKVLSGELNLFLIRFEADGSAGDRAFLAVLRAGDAFCPETSICVGGIRYELAAVPSVFSESPVSIASCNASACSLKNSVVSFRSEAM